MSLPNYFINLSFILFIILFFLFIFQVLKTVFIFINNNPLIFYITLIIWGFVKVIHKFIDFLPILHNLNYPFSLVSFLIFIIILSFLFLLIISISCINKYKVKDKESNEPNITPTFWSRISNILFKKKPKINENKNDQ